MIYKENLFELAQTILAMDPDPVPAYLLYRNGLLPDIKGLRACREGMLKSSHVALLEQTQLPDGSWGRFHSRDSKVRSPFPTTEMAIRRALALGLDQDHPILQKAQGYLEKVMLQIAFWPDPPEKHEGWVHSTRTITAGILSLISPDHPLLTEENEFWLKVLEASFAGGTYDPLAEREIHRVLHGVKTPGKYLKLNAAHPLWILSAAGCAIPHSLKETLLNWLWAYEGGIYYITAGPLTPFPGLGARRYPGWLNGIDLLAGFHCRGEWAKKAMDWIESQRAEDCLWDASPALADPAWFPLSENWRKPHSRRIDLAVRSLLCLQKLV
jgi:hypothetical protein